jgi:hypothetical protein
MPAANHESVFQGKPQECLNVADQFSSAVCPRRGSLHPPFLSGILDSPCQVTWQVPEAMLDKDSQPCRSRASAACAPAQAVAEA